MDRIIPWAFHQGGEPIGKKGLRLAGLHQRLTGRVVPLREVSRS